MKSMKILAEMTSYEHEQVVFCQDKDTGLKAIIAIHDTTLGPALGGTRMWNYDCEEDAYFKFTNPSITWLDWLGIFLFFLFLTKNL